MIFMQPSSLSSQPRRPVPSLYHKKDRAGTNLQPPGEKVKPCIIGTKQSILVDMLARPQGATMKELLKALSGGRRPWTEATVRSGFGWDLKLKGYGVRSLVTNGTERFHLVLPKRGRIPAHITPEVARRLRRAH